MYNYIEFMSGYSLDQKDAYNYHRNINESQRYNCTLNGEAK